MSNFSGFLYFVSNILSKMVEYTYCANKNVEKNKTKMEDKMAFPCENTCLRLTQSVLNIMSGNFDIQIRDCL